MLLAQLVPCAIQTGPRGWYNPIRDVTPRYALYTGMELGCLVYRHGVGPSRIWKVRMHIWTGPAEMCRSLKKEEAEMSRRRKAVGFTRSEKFSRQGREVASTFRPQYLTGHRCFFRLVGRWHVTGRAKPKERRSNAKWMLCQERSQSSRVPHVARVAV